MYTILASSDSDVAKDAAVTLPPPQSMAVEDKGQGPFLAINYWSSLGAKGAHFQISHWSSLGAIKVAIAVTQQNTNLSGTASRATEH